MMTQNTRSWTLWLDLHLHLCTQDKKKDRSLWISRGQQRPQGGPTAHKVGPGRTTGSCGTTAVGLQGLSHTPWLTCVFFTQETYFFLSPRHKNYSITKRLITVLSQVLGRRGLFFSGFHGFPPSRQSDGAFLLLSTKQQQQ